MKKILMATFSLVLIAGLTGCGNAPKNSEDNVAPQTEEVDESYGEDYDSDFGTIGITYGGKPGIELGSGMVMDFETGGISPGFGF